MAPSGQRIDDLAAAAEGRVEHAAGAVAGERDPHLVLLARGPEGQDLSVGQDRDVGDGRRVRVADLRQDHARVAEPGVERARERVPGQREPLVPGDVREAAADDLAIGLQRDRVGLGGVVLAAGERQPAVARTRCQRRRRAPRWRCCRVRPAGERNEDRHTAGRPVHGRIDAASNGRPTSGELSRAAGG